MYLGTIQEFIVDRETNLGYILVKDNEEEEYFLHRNETNHRHLVMGDKVRAFLYLDKKNRIASTLYKPIITTFTADFCPVVDVVQAIGVFISIGISKDILIPKEDLPVKYNEWPAKGDNLLCTLKIVRGKLIARVLSKNDIIALFPFQEYTCPLYKEAFVYRITSDGVNLITIDKQIVFVHHSQLRDEFRLGQKVEVQIVRQNAQDYVGSLIPNIQDQLEKDAQTILDYINKRKGSMNITENSDSEIIKVALGMSKASFKRAIGHLYKNSKIIIEDDKIILL